MANPPQAGKMTPERPFPALIETRKSYPKTGLSPAVRRRFASGAPPWIRPGPAPGFHLVPKETSGQSRTQFQAYKPSIAAFSKVCL